MSVVYMKSSLTLEDLGHFWIGSGSYDSNAPNATKKPMVPSQFQGDGLIISLGKRPDIERLRPLRF